MAYIKSRKHAVARANPPLGHIGGAAAATLMAFALPAGAQTAAPAASASTLQEIRVQGSNSADYKADTSANPKFTAPLLDTPQTIQVIKEQVLREQGATNLTEALRNTPGAGAFYLGENGNTSTGDAIYLRGFDTSSSIFVDGVRDIGSVSRDTFNIEQVEVVKGAASSDIGRTAPTGYINLITKKPRLEDSFYGSLGFGSASYKRGTIDWNKSLTSPDGTRGGAAFRLNAVSEDAGVAGRDMVKNARTGIAPSLALGLGSPTRMYFDYVHMKQSNIPDGGVPTIGLPGYSNPDARAITQAPGRRTFLDYAQPVRSSNFYGTSSDFDRVTSDLFTARFEHDFSPNLTFRNTARWGRTSQDYMLTAFMLGGYGAAANGARTNPAATAGFVSTPNPSNPLGWTVTRNLPTNKNQTNEIIANQSSLTAKFDTGFVSHTLITGLELSREKQSAINYYGQGFNGVATTLPLAGSWPAANLYNPNPYVVGYNRIPNGTGSSGRTDTVGAYVFDTLKFNEQWSLNAGLRYDHYNTGYDATAQTLAITRGLQTSTIVPTSLDTSGRLITGKIGAVYKPVDFGSIYVGYSTGAQPPGGSNFALAAGGTGNNANRTDFLPQKAKTAEIGTKWDVLNKKLSLTAAIYRTDVSNEVVQDTISQQYYQTGKKRVQGLELGAAGAITDAWGVSAGFTTQNTKILSGPSVLADGSSALAYTPKNSFSAWTTYAFPFGLTIGGGARYNGKLQRGADGAVGTPAYIDAYWVFDAMASYRISKNVDLQLNIYNLTDKDYVAAINKSGYRYTPGTPRSARLTANFTF